MSAAFRGGRKYVRFKGQSMRWLIWKEFRLHWPILAFAALLLVVPYVMLLYGPVGDSMDAGRGATAISIVLSYFTTALLGGHAIACERADHSSEFLAYAPVSRKTIVISKLFLPAATVLVIWAVNLAILVFLTTLAKSPVRTHTPNLLLMVSLLACAGFFAFSVAWLVSALQNSPTFAIAAGLAVPWATAALLFFAGWLIGYDHVPEWVGMVVFAGLAIFIGTASFVGGTWYYLRRVEP